ncbi:MAG TPA: TonB-dependent receptor [Verrucomicrobiae bacterium]|nr:TonB-dependent receptor [Verrucomicrobiae bacterium]
MLRTTAFRRHAAASLLTTGLLLSSLFFPNFAHAQLAGSATITGTVTDATGAVVPGADLTIRNTDTRIERKTQTSDAGIYSAAFLPPGHYEVQVSKTGFAAVLRKDLTLQVGQILEINLSLAVQAAQQQVTVTTEAPVVDAEKTEVSQVVSEHAVGNLPIAGRRWDSFVLLTPNVTTDGTSGLVSYRGISGLYNSNTVDGANNNQAFFSEARGRANSGAYVYSMDSIKEYQVSASNFSAELGQAAGGVVNAVTKSGTNDFHGDLFYYLRYPTWNALDSYPKSRGTYSQPIHQWQQFGGSGGGPIVKDKLFFFFTYDGSRKVNPVTYTSNVYSSTVSALPCPSQVTSSQCAAANAFLFGQQGTFPRATNQDVGFGRLDYQVTSNNHVSAAFDFMNYRAPNAYQTSPSYNNGSVTTNGSYVFHERIFVANWDSTISSSAVNNLRFQWGRDLEVAGSNAPAPYINVGGSGGSSNLMFYGENYALPRTAEPDEHRVQISDTLSKLHGRHTMKAGVDFNIIHEVMINLYNGTGQYSYSGTAQAAFNNWVLDAYGINIGDGLTGKHYSTFTQVNDPITHVGKDDFYNNDYAAFFEDNWKASSKLTLNMGLRYDVTTIPQPPQPNTLTPLTTYYTSTINIPKDQFAPRFGAALQLTPKTVLRAGYGIFYAKSTNSTYYATRVENGVYQQTFTCTPSGVTACPTLTFPNVIWTPPGPPMAAPFAGALTPQVVTFTPPSATQLTRGQVPDWVNPRTHQGQVTFERQLPGSFSASVAYVVTRGLHLPIFVDANLAPSTTTKSYDILNSAGQTTQTYTVPFYTARIDTATGGIFVGYSDVNSWYNSMVVTLRHPMRHGLEFTINYTLSKAVDGAQVAGSGGTFNGTDYPIDPRNRKLEYALSDLDQRQRFVANAVWMPSARGVSNHAARMILDGWAFSTIVTMSTGQPVTPYITGAPSPLDGGVTGGVSYAGPTQGRAGWLPRNANTAPGFHNVDFRIGRQFSFTERLKLALIGEAFNLFNHTNVSGVNNTAFAYSAPGSGVCAGHTNACFSPNATYLAPTSTSNLLWGPRQLQLSARLTF